MANRGGLAQGSAARVMWVVAVAEPVTSKDVADILEMNDKHASSALIRLHRSGLVERARCESEGVGGQAYKYRVLHP